MLTRRGFLNGLLAGAGIAAGAIAVPRPKPTPVAPVEEEFTRIVVPMCFYSHTRKVTLAHSLVT